MTEHNEQIIRKFIQATLELEQLSSDYEFYHILSDYTYTDIVNTAYVECRYAVSNNFNLASHIIDHLQRLEREIELD